MATWKDFCKKGQWEVVAPPVQAYAAFMPDSEYKRQLMGQKEELPGEGFGKVLSTAGKALSSAAGAAVGALQQYGEAVGRGDLPSPDMSRTAWDILADPSGSVYEPQRAVEASRQIANGARVGAQVGWNEAGRVAHDLKTTASMVGNDFGLVSDEYVHKLRLQDDAMMIEQMKRHGVPMPAVLPRDDELLLVPTGDPDYAEYDSYVNSARFGQGTGRGALDTAALLASTQGAWKGTKFLANKAGLGPTVSNALALGVSSVPSAAQAAVDTKRVFLDGSKEADKMSIDEYRQMYEMMKGMDPSSQEYGRFYELMRRFSRFDENLFRQLRPPAQSGWDRIPQGTRNLLGIGGLGLLTLFGGWKLGLLGLLLGLANKGGGLKKLWGNLSNSWNAANA